MNSYLLHVTHVELFIDAYQQIADMKYDALGSKVLLPEVSGGVAEDVEVELR